MLVLADVRQDAEMVAFLMHASPRMAPSGTLWTQDGINARSDLERWLARRTAPPAGTAAAAAPPSSPIGLSAKQARVRSYVSAVGGAVAELLFILLIMVASWDHPCDICAGTAVRGFLVLECKSRRAVPAASIAPLPHCLILLTALLPHLSLLPLSSHGS